MNRMCWIVLIAGCGSGVTDPPSANERVTAAMDLEIAAKIIAFEEEGVSKLEALKVDVCHLTKSSGWFVITVSPSSVPAHLRDGDCLVDDGVGCTVDSCDRKEGCGHRPDDGLCDDEVDCTNDSCDANYDCQFDILRVPGCAVSIRTKPPN